VVGGGEMFDQLDGEAGAANVEARAGDANENVACGFQAREDFGALLIAAIVSEEAAKGFDQFAGLEVIHVHWHGGQVDFEVRGGEFLEEFVEIDRDRPGIRELREGERITEHAIALRDGIAETPKLGADLGTRLGEREIQVVGDGFNGA
jgi:hypothetical protein